MRRIVKGQEPRSLTEYRAQPSATFDGYRDREALRQALVSEQRGLCCYCMSRIRADGPMKVEHWRSQSRHPEAQLEYANLLAVCLGGEVRDPSEEHERRSRTAKHHCDTRKGDQDLTRNPASPEHDVDALVVFRGDGMIESSDAAFHHDLTVVLNLNEPRLKNNRKAVLDGFVGGLQKRGELKKETLERWLREWNGDADRGELREFCQVVVYWLRRRLSRA